MGNEQSSSSQASSQRQQRYNPYNPYYRHAPPASASHGQPSPGGYPYYGTGGPPPGSASAPSSFFTRRQQGHSPPPPPPSSSSSSRPATAGSSSRPGSAAPSSSYSQPPPSGPAPAPPEPRGAGASSSTGGSSAMDKAKRARSEGNERFRKEKYAAAIESYTEAICLAPDWEVPYINRALCHKKRSDWTAVEEDSRRALELNSGALKGHYLFGSSMLEKGELAAACSHLTKALELAREQNDGIKDDIWRLLAKAKYKHWEQTAAERRHKRDRLAARLKALMERETAALAEGDAAAAAEIREDIETAEEMFKRCRTDDEKGEIPTAYVCRLTMDVFRDPVMTPSGLSYERSALMEHLKKVGQFDPVTRQRMSASQIVTNMGLRSATQTFLDMHPWAWEECM